MKPLTILSLGAGVQSTCLALMAAKGEVAKVDAAIFADTQAEPEATYRHLDGLKKMLPFPVHTVTAGNIMEKSLTPQKAKTGEDYIRNTIPAYTKDRETGSAGMLLRKCTADYKITPITRKIRELLGKANFRDGRVLVVQYIGISLDEATRAKEARQKYIEHRFPLLDLRMTRHDCIRWLEKNGYEIPPKSACIMCPYHNNNQWRNLRDNAPDEFRRAAKFEEDWNKAATADKSTTRTRGQIYLHRSLKPLDEVDLSTDVERGQLTFLDECDGMCGN